MTGIRLLVAGGQCFDNRAEIDRVLHSIHVSRRIDVLIHGDAPGADRWAGTWARDRGIDVEAFKIPATDGYLGARAPFRRNQRMFDEGKPDMLVAFPGGPGTKDMVSRCVGKIPCLVGIYTSGALRFEKKQWVQVGPATIGWKSV